MKFRSRTATAFAPATVANVAVGFDILGFPIDAIGDTVQVTTIAERVVRIEEVSGLEESLPLDPLKNTATVGLCEMIQDFSLPFGFSVKVRKGIPLGSGMGGSAASAVGALVAANSLLIQKIPREALLRYALMGEFVASGASHPDNVAPCLFGGLTLTRSIDPVEIVQIPVPRAIHCVLVHPHTRLDTRESRKALRREVPLFAHVQQSSNLAGFVAGCYTDDLDLIRSSLSDVLVEPQRAPLIPGFTQAKKAALEAGALGCSISGSGPSVFAWADSLPVALKIQAAFKKAFKKAGLESDAWVSRVNTRGAQLLPKLKKGKRA